MSVGEALVENFIVREKKDDTEKVRLSPTFEKCHQHGPCYMAHSKKINQNKIDLIFICLVSGAYLCVIFGLCCVASIQHLQNANTWQRLHV